jgi:Reverse transcriptase (RNA-dependent DNA polymerase)
LCSDLWGIPQGGVLSALLFSIFVNEVPNLPIWCLAILFADDLSLLIACYPNEIVQTIKKAESDIAKILEWLDCNKLELNASKSEFIIIGSPHNVKRVGTMSINVNMCAISSKDYVKILGFYIDNTLACNVHIKQMVRSLYAKLAPLYTLRPVISDNNLLTLVKSTVFPHLNYMVNIWGSANACILKLFRNF